MDKSWVRENRSTPAYKAGVATFLDFAFANGSLKGQIKCPCKRCNNIPWHEHKVVCEHLTCNGFDQGYANKLWFYHGEREAHVLQPTKLPIRDEPHEVDDMRGMLHAAFGISNPGDGHEDDPIEGPNAEADKFYKLVKDAERELYPGCKKYSTLSFVVRLYHTKCANGWSDNSFTTLLEIVKDTLPEGETLPDSFYKTKKMIGDLGLGYNKIDACPNDCMLYWKESTNASACTVCGTPRWKGSGEQGVAPLSTKDRKIPNKVLRHFPIKPRLQRLFMSCKTASSMRWHAEERTKDGVLRHPADSAAWGRLDERYPDFAAKPRNVMLGLASDGFNPFGTMSIAHSTWPVMLMPYNLPPWMCMKQPYLMMSLLIPGPRAPGNDIDVYMQSLIDELKELWEDSLYTYDASSKKKFMMRAALLWTINDFPAYANLSGWSNKGRYACPHCNKDTCHLYLSKSHKMCYMGHCRFLDANHAYQRDRKNFDGERETRPAPSQLSGIKLLGQMRGMNTIFGKHTHDKSGTKRKRADKEIVGWKKESIFFMLPYWEHLLIRHNLDVMHIEKNICDSVVGTILDMEGKTKDGPNARRDLEQLNIRHALHVTDDGNSKEIPAACYTMSPTEKSIFCTVLSKVKVPDGYAANISRCVNLKERKLSGLKSHDCHILMQQLLPIAVLGVLPKNVSAVLIDLCSFFRDLCSKVGTVEGFRTLEDRIPLTLCHLERIFPPAFFDIMVHLAIHLAGEAMVAGLVQYRWMYLIERYLLTLKTYVRNKSHPEGSIAEGYLAEECLTFCSRYLHNVETRMNREPRNYDGADDVGSSHGLSIFSSPGRALGKMDSVHMFQVTCKQMHSYVLFNCPEVIPFIEEHIEMLNTKHPDMQQIDIKRIHNDDFPNWFEARVRYMYREGDESVSELRWLAGGARPQVLKYKRFVINGFRFRTKDVDNKSKTQNSGVVVTAKTPSSEDVTYYGVLTNIIELEYYQGRKFVLFKCDWVDLRGIKQDQFGFTLVNLNRRLITNEPYVLASQALQVFYVPNPIQKEWNVAIKIKPRDEYNMVGEGSENDGDSHLEFEPPNVLMLEESGVDVDNIIEVRPDVLGTSIEAPILVVPVPGEEEGSESEFDE